MSSKYGPGFPWSPEAVADLRKFKADGLSCSEIAKRLSATYKAPVSRSAVIGKAMREGIATPPKPVKIRALVPPATRSNVAKLPKRTAQERVTKELVSQRRAADLIRHEREKAAAPVEVPAVHPDLIAVAPADIMGLRLDSCRWPLERTDDHGETLFCCNTRSRGFYCEGHAKRAFTRANAKSPGDVESDAARRAKQLAPFVAGRFAWSKGLVRRSA